MTDGRIRAAMDKVGAAEKELYALIASLCPVGSVIQWEQRSGVHCAGDILIVAWDRLKVRNASTGKEYWIYANQVTLAAIEAEGKA